MRNVVPTDNPASVRVAHGKVSGLVDSLTQAALGAAVGQLVAGRRLGRRAALLGAACGTIPDLDVLISYADPVAQMTYHRTWSHSFFWLTLATPVMWLLARATPLWRDGGKPMLLAIWLALITHPVLDCFTIYGTQALLPFSDYPISLGSVFIIDPFFTLPLVVALVVAWRNPAALRQQRVLGSALGFGAAYLLLSVVIQGHMQRQARLALPVVANTASPVKATPTAFNTLRWRLLVREPGRHCDQFVGLFGSVDADGWRCYTQRPDLERKLAGHWPYERMRWFTHGWFSVTHQGDKVILSDLRMGVERFYVFRFVVAEMRDGVMRPVTARQLPTSRPSLATLPLAYGHPQSDQP